jgi:hypothetical protein
MTQERNGEMTEREKLVKIINGSLPCTCDNGEGIICVKCFYKKSLANDILAWHKSEVEERIKPIQELYKYFNFIPTNKISIQQENMELRQAIRKVCENQQTKGE